MAQDAGKATFGNNSCIPMHLQSDTLTPRILALFPVNAKQSDQQQPQVNKRVTIYPCVVKWLSLRAA